MKKRLLTAVMSTGLLFSTAAPSMAVTTYYSHYRTQDEYVRHRQHMKTAKRVGVGAVGGAVIGGIAGGGTGALIGGAAGGGAGYLWDRHKKHQGGY